MSFRRFWWIELHHNQQHLFSFHARNFYKAIFVVNFILRHHVYIHVHYMHPSTCTSTRLHTVPRASVVLRNQLTNMQSWLLKRMERLKWTFQVFNLQHVHMYTCSYMYGTTLHSYSIPIVIELKCLPLQFIFLKILILYDVL